MWRARPIEWNKTATAEFPYEATVEGKALMIRLNDFPAEIMYTLFVEGKEHESFNDWPAVWKRPAAGKATSARLSPEDFQLVRACVERERAHFARFLPSGPPGAWPAMVVREVEQTFFPRIRILSLVGSDTPLRTEEIHVALVSSAQTAHVVDTDTLREIIGIDPPQGLTDPALARKYAWTVERWTFSPVLGALHIASAAEIPWLQKPNPQQAARIAELEAALWGRIGPERVERLDEGWQFCHWLVRDRRLVERTIVVAFTGELVVRERIEMDAMPVPERRY